MNEKRCRYCGAIDYGLQRPMIAKVKNPAKTAVKTVSTELTREDICDEWRVCCGIVKKALPFVIGAAAAGAALTLGEYLFDRGRSK